MGPSRPRETDLDAEHQRAVAVAVAEFERSIGIDPDHLGTEDDAADHHGAPGGDPQGRTGPDTTIGGTGPGGPKARVGGDHEGSETVGALEGSRRGSALGVEDGSESGRFGGDLVLSIPRTRGRPARTRASSGSIGGTYGSSPTASANSWPACAHSTARTRRAALPVPKEHAEDIGAIEEVNPFVVRMD